MKDWNHSLHQHVLVLLLLKYIIQIDRTMVPNSSARAADRCVRIPRLIEGRFPLTACFVGKQVELRNDVFGCHNDLNQTMIHVLLVGIRGRTSM